MNIKKIETFTNKYVGFVRVTLDSGQTGWGQVSTYNADITCQILHRQVAPWALGKEATNIDAINYMIEDREHKFPGSYVRRAMAGLDTALWDLQGKLAGKPVTELLGGTPGTDINEAGEFDRLYIVTVDESGEASTLLVRYGVPFKESKSE